MATLLVARYCERCGCPRKQDPMDFVDIDWRGENGLCLVRRSPCDFLLKPAGNSGQSRPHILATLRGGSGVSNSSDTHSHCQRSRSSRYAYPLTTQRGIMATSPAALLRSWGRPSRLHPMRRKRSALPSDPSERGGPPPLVGLSPGLCGSVWRVAYFTHRTVTADRPCRETDANRPPLAHRQGHPRPSAQGAPVVVAAGASLPSAMGHGPSGLR